MISLHQPAIFKGEIVAAVSSIEDGSMSRKVRSSGVSEEDVDHNRASFLQANGIQPDQATLVQLDYDTDNFARYREVAVEEKGDLRDNTAPADALVVVQPHHALFLPLADCVGAILYDPVKRVLMVSHLGRHSTYIHGATKSVQFLVKNYGVNPANILVWLSPAVGKVAYPLPKFDNRSLHEVNYEHLKAAGVVPEHIEIVDVDTAMDDNYFSHSQYRKGLSKQQGRFAVVAMMPMGVQGEPAF